MTTVQTSAKFDTLYCRDPMLLCQEAMRLGFAVDHWWGKPNSFRCPRGKEPGRGWVILSRKDVLGNREAVGSSGIDLTATHSLEFKYGTTTLTIPGLYVQDVRALYADSYNSSNESTYLVELADKRAIFALSTINCWYNTLCPDPPADDDTGAFTSTSLYYANSLNSGALWTWATMLADIWDELPGQGTGDAPTLPYTPDDYPRNFRFVGVSAWEAYNTVLEKIGCVLCYNPITQAFSVVRLNATQALGALDTDTDLISSYSHQSGVTTYPATIRVFFPRRDEHHGSEKELQQTAGNYRDTAAYSKDVASGIPGAVAGTVVALWDDWPAIYEFDGTHANQSECDDRAAEVAANYAAKLRYCDGPYRRLFYGLKTAVLCGSEIAEVRWGDTGHPQLGMTTEYRGSELADDSDDGGCGPVVESLLPPDVVRHGFPDYPRLVHMVEVTAALDESYGVYPAKVVRLDPEQDLTSASYTDDVNCFLFPLNDEGFSDGNQVLARLIGSATATAGTRPLFVADKGGSGVRFGVVQSGFTNGYGDEFHVVSVKSCDYLGGNITGAAFNVYTLPAHNLPGASHVAPKDTALYTDYIVGYVTCPITGDKVIITDCYDDPFETCRYVADDVALRDGWDDLDDAEGRFVLCKADDAGSEPSWASGSSNYGATGGQYEHRHCLPNSMYDVSAGGVTLCDGSQTDLQEHIPPWISLKMIYRPLPP